MLLLHRDAEQPQVPELRPKLTRKFVALVDFGGERRNLVGGESTNAGSKLVGRLAQIEVKRREVVWDHDIHSPLALLIG